MAQSTTPSRGPRWWPAVVVAVLLVAALGWVWLIGDQFRQARVMATALLLVAGSALLLVWLTFFSRLRWRTRLATWAVLALVAVSFFSAFRFRGVTGDLVPVFDPRWKGRAETVSGGGRTSSRRGPEEEEKGTPCEESDDGQHGADHGSQPGHRTRSRSDPRV